MQKQSEVTRPTRLAHIVFRTKKLDAMIAWYESVLGAHVVFRSDKIAFLTYDDEHHRIALIHSSDLVERPRNVHAVGFYHSAFTYTSLSELMHNYVRLKSAGIEPWRSILHGPTVSQYYRDPDGNDVELQVDAFESAEAATAWMNGKAFEKNPIGEPFDPAEMIRRLEDGVPEALLMRRSDS